MKMCRTACMIAALLVLAGGALRAQELLFGLGPMPKGSSELHKVPLTDETWIIPVSSEETTRLIQIASLGPEKNITAELACSRDAKPMQNLAWVIAKGDCLLRFKPLGGVGKEPVKLTVVAAALESSKISTRSLAAGQIPNADQNSVKAMISLEAGKASEPSDAKPGGKPSPTLADQLRPALLIFGITLVVGVIVWLLFFRYKKAGPSGSDKSGKNELEEIEADHPRQTSESFSPAGKGTIHEVPRPRESPFPVDPPMQETAVEKTLREHSRLLLDLTSRDQNLETRIHEVADRCISMLSQSTRQADDEIRSDTIRRMHEAESSLAALQKKLSDHLASQSSTLQDLFKDLPALADLSTTPRVINKSDLLRLEDNLVSAARQSALSVEKLEALQDDSSGLLDAIQEFVQTAESTNRDRAKKRLARVIESATVVNNELFNLGQLAATQKHGFFVEMSLLEKTSLAEDLAAALTRETMKLSDPEGYYLKRLEALRAHTCVAGIDLADLDVDSERKNGGLQQALAKLLQTLGMTPIDPRQNDKLQAAEHQVVQFVRRVPGVQPGTVAHTMARGLQRGGDVIRKASVLLYE